LPLPESACEGLFGGFIQPCSIHDFNELVNIPFSDALTGGKKKTLVNDRKQGNIIAEMILAGFPRRIVR
jgi:hypothetical protein